MTIVEMLGQSSVLTLLGMGIVFSFLVIMIIAITLVGKFIHILGQNKDTAAPVNPPSSPDGAVRAGNAAVTAVISAAVNEYRKTTNP
jgi:oxaloacetate decarboxylase gamma subunit